MKPNVYEISLQCERIIQLVELRTLPFDSLQDYTLKKILQLMGGILKEKINLMIKTLQCPDPQRNIITLSGEKTPGTFVRTLISEPELLILDEPTIIF